MKIKLVNYKYLNHHEQHKSKLIWEQNINIRLEKFTGIADGITNIRLMTGVCLVLQNGGIVQKCINIDCVFLGLNSDFK